MKPNKEQQTNQGIEQLAAVIAETIVNLQRRIAAVINTRVNRISKPRQLWLLFIGSAIIAGALVSGVLWPGKIVVNSSFKNYTPTHVGMPSEMPRPTKSTDSLTINK